MYPWIVVLLLALAAALSVIDRYILFLLINVIAPELHLSDTEIGLINGAGFSILYAVLGLAFGRLADTRNRRNLIAAAVFIWSAMTVSMGFVRTGPQLFLSRIGLAAGEAALAPASFSMVSGLFDERAAPRAVGLLFMGSAVAPGFAMLIGGALFHYFLAHGPILLPFYGWTKPWQSVFMSMGIPGLVLSVVIRVIVKEPLRHTGREKADSSSSSSTSFAHWFWSHSRLYFPLFAGITLISTDFSALMTWGPAFFERTYGWSPMRTGSFLGVLLSICGVIGPGIGAYCVQALRRRGYTDALMRAVLILAILSVPSAVAASIGTSANLNLLGMAVTITLFMGLFSIAPAVILVTTPDALRGRVYASYHLTLALISATLGPLLVGVLNDRLFGSPGELGYSLSATALLTIPLGLWMCMKASSELRKKYETGIAV